MKILIVDDEKLTREGIISTINWIKFGIDEIYEADDGYHGLEAGKKYRPDIILSDVRMPRMNGIEMLKELQKLLPLSSFILMSGYSDKEYLKEAIKLKVINYVEKPIDAAEVDASIVNALEEQYVNKKNRLKSDIHNKYSQSKLGLQITYPIDTEQESNLKKQFQDLDLKIKPETEFTTLILTLKTAISSISEQHMDELYCYIESTVYQFHMHYIVAVKNDEYIILHLFTNKNTSDYSIKQIYHALSEFLSKTYLYFIAVGKTVTGIKNVFESYNTAVLLLQSSFYYDYNSIIIQEIAATPKVFDSSLLSRFSEGLKHQNEEETLGAAKEIYGFYKNNQHVLPNIAKDLYYKLFTLLIETADLYHISGFFDEGSASVLEYISKDKNLLELNSMLIDKIHLLFSSMQENSNDNATVYAIKEFIRKNYQNEMLSVKDISEHVFLSSSYVCTLFKNETGKTLNQFITEFRIDKAKGMLKDSRYKISEISTKVGYSDGNYFGKTFKKSVDLSPSEYRERYIK
jgi:two-component system, response regulator YesN